MGQVNTILPNGLLQDIDEMCGDGETKRFNNRQDFIREAIRDKIQSLRKENGK